ncbi:hypothetical protein OSTOST_18131, partial [Ostertagia ostertagi]
MRYHYDSCFMSKGKFKESEPARVCCFFVTTNSFEQGNAGHSASQAKSSYSSPVADPDVIAEVYNNDLLMRHIVSFVTDIN